MKKIILKARYVAFVVMAISICTIESDTKIPLVTLLASVVVLFISTFVKEEDDERITK